MNCGAVKVIEKTTAYASYKHKGDVGNAILDTKGKIVLALFSVYNKQTGVS